MPTAVELDTAQDEAASIAPGERQIVIAGPGAGKSEVVGALARRFVDGGLNPQGILVISFSRAAVDIVRRRTVDVTHEGEQVDAATIDSLAARVIHDLGEDDTVFTGYERNIEIAVRLLLESERPPFDDIDHVIVDEIQDVVGVRARFVEALLTHGVRADTGFTLLGDPLQSIYGFAEKDMATRTAEHLLACLKSRFQPTVRELTGEYRSRTADARLIGGARADLLLLAGQDRLRRLRTLLSDLSPLGDIDDEVVADIADWTGTTALLCDTNARAALVAGQFSAAGVPVETAGSAAHPSLAPWLAQVLTGRGESAMTRAEFLDAATGLGVQDPVLAWRALVTVGDARRGIDIRRLADRLVGRTVPPELARLPESRIISSTVHRAKGLEFDNVVMVDPERWTHKNSHPDDDARLLFVAASRAHGRLTTARGPETKRWSKGRGPWARWEFRPHPRAVPGGTLLAPSDMWPAENLVRTPDCGVQLTWERADIGHLDAKGDEVPTWNAAVAGQIVAMTSAGFGAYMKSHRHVDRLKLEGGRIHGFETRISPASDGSPIFRLMPRIAGPLTWERN